MLSLFAPSLFSARADEDLLATDAVDRVTEIQRMSTQYFTVKS